MKEERIKKIIKALNIISIILIIVPILITIITDTTFKNTISYTLIIASYLFTLVGSFMSIMVKRKKEESYTPEIRYLVLLTLFLITIIMR